MEILINLLKQEFSDKNKYEKVFYIINFFNYNLNNLNNPIFFFNLFKYLWSEDR